jgi:hypothetical protein
VSVVTCPCLAPNGDGGFVAPDKRALNPCAVPVSATSINALRATAAISGDNTSPCRFLSL